MPISAENAILTKSRAMLGRHLTKDDYRNLLNCRTVAEVASYLKTKTSYGKALENINETTVHRGQLETVLREKLFENYASLCRYQLTIGEDFSEYLIIKGEIEQVLKFLRLFMAGHPEEYIFSLPVFFSKHSTIDLYELSRARSAQDFFQAVSNSRYAKVLAPYAANSSVLDFTGIEHALYQYMYMRMISLIEKNTRGSEKREMTELIGVQIDLLNFAHIYRLKRYFDSNPDYVRSLTFPYNYKLSKATVEAMITAAKSDDVMDIFSRSPAYAKYLDKLDYSYVDDFVNIVKFEVAKKYIRFSVNPSVVLMSYLIILETEIDDIINVIEGVRYQIQPEEIAPLIISHGHKKEGSGWQS